MELIADIRTVLDRIDPSSFPFEQQLKYNKRKYVLGEVLADSTLSESAFQALAAEGSTAGYFLRARSLGPDFGAEAPDDAGPSDQHKAATALAFLTEHWSSIKEDDRCLRYYLQCRWLTAVGQRLFRGQRSALPFKEADRRDLLRIVEAINAQSGLGSDNFFLYLQAVLAWLVNDDRFAFDTWRDLSRETEFLDPKRVVRRHLLTDENHVPMLFSGRLESDADPFTIRIDGWNRTIRLLERDFSDQQIGYGARSRNLMLPLTTSAQSRIRQSGRRHDDELR